MPWPLYCTKQCCWCVWKHVIASQVRSRVRDNQISKIEFRQQNNISNEWIWLRTKDFRHANDNKCDFARHGHAMNWAATDWPSDMHCFEIVFANVACAIYPSHAETLHCEFDIRLHGLYQSQLNETRTTQIKVNDDINSISDVSIVSLRFKLSPWGKNSENW